MHLPERNIGLNFNREGLATIRVWAPLAKTLNISVNGLTLPLIKDDLGYWTLTTNEIQHGDYYWLLLDDQQLPDPASLAQPLGVHGPSQAIDFHNDTWHDLNWVNHPLNEYIIYEIHTGTFSNEGDFDGIAKHIEHLVGLGITAIELMPVAAFPGSRNWGYDGVFPYAVQHSYGGYEGLRKLVEACHQNGIAVILDVVYNHIGPEGNYLPQFGPYFTDKYKTPWGDAVNFDDNGSYGAREFFIENALMWFRDFHIDALRLDAVHAIKDFSAVHLLQEISTRTAILMAQTGRVHYLIAESDLNDPRYITAVSANGMGMNAQWADEFHHALRVTAGEEKLGYYSDFSGIEHLAKSYQEAYVYTELFSPERNRIFGKSAPDCEGKQFVVFSQNHDQVGNRMLGERSSQLFSFEMLKLFASAVFISPFLQMLFMGEEWAETNPFQYFVSHTDPELVALVRKGRSEEFSAMHQGDAPDPQSEDTFLNSKLNWNLIQEPRSQALIKYYKALITLRKSNLVLKMCDRDSLKIHLYKEQNCLVIERGLTGSDQVILGFLNFSAKSQSLPIPAGLTGLQLLLQSASNQYYGSETQAPQLEGHQLLITPTSFIAYSATYA
ncbi:MAG: malto-oligosyltrehalose trehalohydrolase [Bacteroidota bacterium]